MRTNHVIIGPVLTEKSTRLAQTQVYAFIVAAKATKFQIKTALQAMYPVSISDVRVLNRIGKMRKTGKKQKPAQMSGKSIAYVSVTKGTIDVFPKA